MQRRRQGGAPPDLAGGFLQQAGFLGAILTPGGVERALAALGWKAPMAAFSSTVIVGSGRTC